MPDDFDAAYRQTTPVYGEAPDPLLTAHQQHIAPGRPVLDLGSGQGRHALALARAGHEVHALDPAAVAVAILSELATQEGLPIRCLQCHFQEFPGRPGSYAAVLAFGLIPILTWEDIATLRAALSSWLAPGGPGLPYRLHHRGRHPRRLRRPLATVRAEQLHGWGGRRPHVPGAGRAASTFSRPGADPHLGGPGPLASTRRGSGGATRPGPCLIAPTEAQSR